jgi:hypothetical protein
VLQQRVDAAERGGARAVLDAVAALQRRAADHGFRVSRRASKISGGGDGLFLTGTAKQGDVVALYPGRYFPPPPLWAVSSDGPGAITCPPLDGDTGSFDSALGDNSYCLHVYPFGGFLDAVDGHSFEAIHPFALGHLANHPEAGQPPTVTTVTFLWRHVALIQDQRARADMQLAPASYPVPNEMKAGFWFLDPATGEPVDLVPTVHSHLLVGCALVALTDLGGRGAPEEMTLDYGLKPPFPPWYHAVAP